MNLDDNIDQICNELTFKIEALRRIFKKNPKGNINFNLAGAEIGKDKKKEFLEKTVQEVVLELEKTKKQFKSKTIKEVREKLIKALKE